MGFWNKEKQDYELKVYTEIEFLKKQQREKLKNQYKFGDDLGNNHFFITANIKQNNIAYSSYNKEKDCIEYLFFNEDALTEIAKENIK